MYSQQVKNSSLNHGYQQSPSQVSFPVLFVMLVDSMHHRTRQSQTWRHSQFLKFPSFSEKQVCFVVHPTKQNC